MSHSPTKDWQWPGAASDATLVDGELFVPVSVKSLEQLRKDREELAAALQDRVDSQPNCVCNPEEWVNWDGWKCPACRDRALLARIRGGG